MTRPLATSLLAAAALTLAGLAHAQMYRSVGPDGRVTYTDQPPATNARDTSAAGGASDNDGGGALSYQLNQIAQRYPVTLYTASSCTACNAGRNLLINRGIPFSEKTVESTQASVDALQRLAGGTELPVLTIGGQRLKGFSDQDWTQYLDAAGYPKTSQLPSTYRRPAPTPLVAVQTTTANTPPAEAAPSRPAPEPSIAPQITPDNPTGIRF